MLNLHHTHSSQSGALSSSGRTVHTNGDIILTSRFTSTPSYTANMIDSGGWFVDELDGDGDDSRSVLPPIMEAREGEEGTEMDIVETPIKQDLEANGSRRSFFAF